MTSASCSGTARKHFGVQFGGKKRPFSRYFVELFGRRPRLKCRDDPNASDCKLVPLECRHRQMANRRDIKRQAVPRRSLASQKRLGSFALYAIQSYCAQDGCTRTCMFIGGYTQVAPADRCPWCHQRRAVSSSIRTLATTASPSPIASTSAAGANAVPHRPRLEKLRAESAQIDDFLGPDPISNSPRERIVFAKNKTCVPGLFSGLTLRLQSD